MLLLKKDFVHGIVSLKINQPDDLWYISHLIEIGDCVKAKTERKIKLGEADTNTKIIKKILTLSLLVESIDFSDDISQIRIKGKVNIPTTDVPAGAYHSFGFSVGDSFTLEKKEWSTYLKKRLDEAVKSSSETVLFALFDREEVLFSTLRQTGIEHIAQLSVSAAKKQFNTDAESIFPLIKKQIDVFEQQYNPKHIVFASSSFWHPNMEKQLTPELKKKSSFLSAGTVSKATITELLSRPELHRILEHQRISKEEIIVALLLEKLHKDFVSYGFDDVKNAVNIGAIETLLVTDNYIKKTRLEGTYESLDALLKTVDVSQGDIHILTSDHACKVIDGLGGIAGIVRWKQ